MNPYAAEEKKTILGHPRGLFVLFFAHGPLMAVLG